MQRNKLLLFSGLFTMALSAHAQETAETPIPPPAIMEQPSHVDPLEALDKKNSPAASVETPADGGVPVPEIVNTESSAVGSEKALVKPAKKNKKKAKKSARKSRSQKNYSAAVGDDPDLRKEERFHEIYQKYNAQPTSEESWEKAIGSRKAEVYHIQQGDTLWDISNTFFGDPNYWPKIWSLNVGSIGNPHEVDPKMAIQFYPGSMADAPTLGMVESEKLDLDGPEGLKGIAVASNGDVPVPTSKRRKYAPLLKKIPPSIPLYRYGTVQVPPPTLELPTRKVSFSEQPEYLSYYVTNESPASVGQVVETEMGMSTASEYQYLIVRLDKSAGKKLVALKELDKVADIATSTKAHLIEVQGTIEVLERVNEGENLYRAMVKKNLQPIAVGAKLMEGGLPTFDPSPTAVDGSHTALIIGGQYENDRRLFGSRALVFLNGGSAQGFQVGQSMNVYSDIRNRNPNSRAQTNDRINGTIKIVNVSETFSTAYVTHATDDILIGDHIGAQGYVATGPVVSEPSAETSPEASGDSKATGEPLNDFEM